MPQPPRSSDTLPVSTEAVTTTAHEAPTASTITSTATEAVTTSVSTITSSSATAHSTVTTSSAAASSSSSTDSTTTTTTTSAAKPSSTTTSATVTHSTEAHTSTAQQNASSSTTTTTTTTYVSTNTTVTLQTATITTVVPVNGESPNASFYQQRMAVAGDSIAHGFNVFGFIPYQRCITQGSVSMWNLSYFTFNYGYGPLGLVDAVNYVHPKFLYMSLGMNDVNMNTAEKFASTYVDTINKIMQKVPDINIVVAGITPVYDGIAYTNNAKIRSYNAALEKAVKAMDSKRVYYFDAYSVLADPITLALKYGTSSGDGIHLAVSCYNAILKALYNFMDATTIKEQIIQAESNT